MLTSLLPQKTPLDKYNEQKASISTMMAAGDTTADVAKKLMNQLELELLHITLI